MRIAFFIRSMTNGGAEKVAVQLTCIWAGLGHETVLLTELPESNGCEYGCECIAREVVGGEAAIVPQRLSDLHEKYGFDVAVFNDAINSDWFTAAFDEAKAIGLRTIIINHHTSNNWMYGCCNTKELFMDDVLRKADAMVCVDRIWALWWKYRGAKAVFIENPVSVGKMRDESGEMRYEDSPPILHASFLTLVNNVEEAVEKLKGKRNIVWIGRIGDALKRPELAIRVFARLVKEGMRDEGEGIQLTMLGTCNKATKKRLRSLFTSLVPHHSSPIPHTSSLLFPGFVSNVDEYLAKADAHLFTSVTEVTVPQVVLEAMTAGIETIAFDQPVLREVVSSQSPVVGEKWRKVLAGDDVECDFDTPEVRQRLMDELHRSQQWFAERHLPELQTFRRWKTRMSFRYLVGRLMKKIVVSR